MTYNKMNSACGIHVVLNIRKDKVDGALDELNEGLATFDKEGLVACEKPVKERREEDSAPSTLLSKIWEVSDPDVVTCQAFGGTGGWALLGLGLMGSCGRRCRNFRTVCIWFCDNGSVFWCGALRRSSSQFRWQGKFIVIRHDLGNKLRPVRVRTVTFDRSSITNLVLT